MSDQNEKVNNSGSQGNGGNRAGKPDSKGKKPLDSEGEYVDYEEIK